MLVLATLLIRSFSMRNLPIWGEFWVEKLPDKGRKRQTECGVGCKKSRPTPKTNNVINLKQAINNLLVACFVVERIRGKVSVGRQRVNNRGAGHSAPAWQWWDPWRVDNPAHTSQGFVVQCPDGVEPGCNTQRTPAPSDATGGNGGWACSPGILVSDYRWSIRRWHWHPAKTISEQVWGELAILPKL